MEFLKKFGILNLLLVFVPIAIAMKFAGASEPTVFVLSAVAIIPLAGLMGRSTEMLAHRVGPGIGGLMNASFGNAAELIIAVSALRQGLIGVVKASITGSILGNILLVLGASFFAGGLRYNKQRFNATAAGMSATLLAIAAIGMLVPAMFHAHLVIHHEVANEKDLSLEIAVVLFAVYVLLLLFSLKTHKHLYNSEAEDGQQETEEKETGGPFPELEYETDEANVWPVKTAIAVLIGATVCVAVMSELLVGAIEVTSQRLGWTHIFVGIFVVAIVGNAAEHSSAILAAMKNRMELGFQIAVGSGLQVALFVAPLLVFISYLPGFPVTLDLVFSMMEVVAVAVSVLIVGLVAYDGESNWMEGLLLLAVYLILGIAFFHLPLPAH